MRIGWVHIRSFETLPSAELARTALALAGIDSCLENGELVSMAWHYGNAVGYVKLLVPTSDAEQAIGLLGTPAERTPDDVCLSCGADVSERTGTCPNCGWTAGESRLIPGESDEPCPVCGTDVPEAAGVCSVCNWRLHGPLSAILQRLRGWKHVWLGYYEALPGVLLLLGLALGTLFGLGGALITHPFEASIVAIFSGISLWTVLRIGGRRSPEPVETPVETSVEWSVNDPAMVQDGNEAPWSATILEIGDGFVTVRADDDGERYDDIETASLRPVAGWDPEFRESTR